MIGFYTTKNSNFASGYFGLKGGFSNFGTSPEIYSIAEALGRLFFKKYYQRIKLLQRTSKH